MLPNRLASISSGPRGRRLYSVLMHSCCSADIIRPWLPLMGRVLIARMERCWPCQAGVDQCITTNHPGSVIVGA